MSYKVKIFCHSCGYKMEYTMDKPKFCQQCGCSLVSTASKPTPQPEVVVEQEVVEEKEESKPLPNLKNLDFEISHAEKPKLTVGDVGLQPPSSEEAKKYTRIPDESISKEQFLENWKKEAGSLRNK